MPATPRASSASDGDAYEKNGLTRDPGGDSFAAAAGSAWVTDRRPTGATSGKGGRLRADRTAEHGARIIARTARSAWRPAIDVNRIVLGGQVVALAAIVVTRARSARAVAAPQDRCSIWLRDLRTVLRSREHVPRLARLLPS